MGCASSKQKRCRHCQAPHSPVNRSYSMHVVHPPQQKGDTYHVVALTSTTLGSLSRNYSSCRNIEIPDINISINKQHPRNDEARNIDVDYDPVEHKEVKNCVGYDYHNNKEEFLMGLIEAKTWSNMIEGKIPKKNVPKTPIMTPPGEPEMINAWEIMEGLEDASPLNLPHRFRSFSFDVSHDDRKINAFPESPKITSKNPDSNANSNRPIWLQLVEEDAFPSYPEFDYEVLSTFSRSLQELSPNHPSYLKPNLDDEKESQLIVDGNEAEKVCNGIGKVLPFKQGKEKVVVYFTSLRGVRKTYEDCCYVRVILKGLGVKIDDRDVSMHSGFKDELRELLGEGYLRRPGGLPRVFIGRKYIGGAEEIRKLHEEEQLERLVEGCEMADDGVGSNGGGGGYVCEACGDIRFVPCETCSGSCKVYYEADEEEQEEDLEGENCGEFGFQRCPDCNENGLIRCPICCD